MEKSLLASIIISFDGFTCQSVTLFFSEDSYVGAPFVLQKRKNHTFFGMVLLYHSVRVVRSQNFVNWLWKNSLTVSTGPLRCLAMMTSVMFLFSVSLS